VLGVFMPTVSAAALLLIPSFVTNVWQLATGSDFRTLRAWDEISESGRKES